MSTPGGGDVRREVRDGVATIVLDRPPVNAFSTAMWESLADALSEIEADDAARVIVVRSGLATGPFCAGADVRELPMTPDQDERRMALVRRTLELIAATRVPTIASIAGACVGSGCALVAACDVRLASSDARFALPEIDVGRCGGARHLMRVLPQGIVRHLAFSGKPLSAQRAYELGMLLEITSDRAALAEATDELAAALAAKSPTALRTAKRSLDAAEELTLSEGYAVEQRFSLELARTPDAAEAATAFVEHRPPNWQEE